MDRDRPSLTATGARAVFRPILGAQNLGSVKILRDLPQGRPPVMPKLGFASSGLPPGPGRRP
jgi:hypothetical protein